MMDATTTLHKSLIVFTDLDGTLIDHSTYSVDVARGALRLLANQNVPVIFCSSKTFSEQRFIQDQLGLIHPFILENGSAVAIPSGYFPKSVLESYTFITDASGYEIFRVAYAEAHAIKSILMDFADIKGFADVSDKELEALTGLSGNDLQRARERWFTETLITPLNPVRVKEIADKLGAFGFVLSRGGRFYTIQSKQANKGKAVRWLAGIFREVMTHPPVCAAIGDSPNDISMLASVDHAFLVQRHDGSWTDTKLPDVTMIDAIGPAGFTVAVNLLLSKYMK